MSAFLSGVTAPVRRSPFFFSSTSSSRDCSAFFQRCAPLFNALMRPLSRRRHAPGALMLSIFIITCSAFAPAEFGASVCEPVLVRFHTLPLSCGLGPSRTRARILPFFLCSRPFCSPPPFSSTSAAALIKCASVRSAQRKGSGGGEKKKSFFSESPLFYFLMHNPFISPSSGPLVDIITGFNCHAALITAELSFSLHTS